jgi:hypothetical protein
MDCSITNRRNGGGAGGKLYCCVNKTAIAMLHPNFLDQNWTGFMFYFSHNRWRWARWINGTLNFSRLVPFRYEGHRSAVEHCRGIFT